MRFSLSAMLAGITLAGICIFALAGSNELSFQLMTFVAFVCSVVAGSLAWAGLGKCRIFAIGFLIGCVPYVYLTQPYDHTRREFLISGAALETIDYYLKLSQETRTPAGETVHLLENNMAHINSPQRRTSVKTWQEIDDMGYMKYAYRTGEVPTHRHFMAIGHLALALLIGGVNGVLICRLNGAASSSYQRDESKSPPTV